MYRRPNPVNAEHPSSCCWSTRQRRGELSRASEVSNDEFKRLTGTALAEGEGSETITEYRDSLRAIVTGRRHWACNPQSSSWRRSDRPKWKGNLSNGSAPSVWGVAGMETMQPRLGNRQRLRLSRVRLRRNLLQRKPRPQQTRKRSRTRWSTGEYGQQDVDTGPATAEFGTGEALELYGFALPELVELATNLLEGAPRNE